MLYRDLQVWAPAVAGLLLWVPFQVEHEDAINRSIFDNEFLRIDLLEECYYLFFATEEGPTKQNRHSYLVVRERTSSLNVIPKFKVSDCAYAEHQFVLLFI